MWTENKYYVQKIHDKNRAHASNTTIFDDFEEFFNVTLFDSTSAGCDNLSFRFSYSQTSCFLDTLANK